MSTLKMLGKCGVGLITQGRPSDDTPLWTIYFLKYAPCLMSDKLAMSDYIFLKIAYNQFSEQSR